MFCILLPFVQFHSCFMDSLAEVLRNCSTKSPAPFSRNFFQDELRVATFLTDFFYVRMNCQALDEEPWTPDDMEIVEVQLIFIIRLYQNASNFIISKGNSFSRSKK